MASKKELKAENVELRKQLVKLALEVETLKLRIHTLEARPPIVVKGPVWEIPDRFKPPYDVTVSTITTTDADARKYRVWL